MNYLFLIGTCISFAILILLVIGFFRLRSQKIYHKIIIYFSLIGVLYFLMGLLSLFWFMNFLSYSESDFLILYGIVIFLQSILLFKVIVLFTQNNKLFYFLFFYIIAVISIFYSIEIFFNIVIISSFLLCLLFFIDLTFRSDIYRVIGFFGIFYSFIGVVFQGIFLAGILPLYVLNIFLAGFFFALSFAFLRDLKKYPPVVGRLAIAKEKPYFFKLIRHLIFIIVLVNFIFIGTVAIHEMGHFVTGKFMGCEVGKIIYENNYFHTEVLCAKNADNNFVLWGGIVIPFVLAIVLFFMGGRFMKEIAVIVFGFNFIAVSRDLADLGISGNMVLVSVFFGVVFLILGIVMLSKSRVEDSVYLHSNKHLW